MSATSSIEWTNKTWNPTGGCDRISPGCANCYAKAEWDRRHKGHLAGKKVAAQYATPFEVLQMFDDRLEAPLSWRSPQRVFVNSVSDLFHEDVPDAFIDRVFAVMALAPRHTFQILTKRPERMRRYLNVGLMPAVRIAAAAKALHTKVRPFALPSEEVFDAKRVAMGLQWIIPEDRAWPLRNVWLGVSVENQHFADERIPLLLQTPAAVRFISAEPLLGPVCLTKFIGGSDTAETDLGPEDAHCVRCGCLWEEDSLEHQCPPGFGPRLDWVIVGGESGPGARPFDLAWARSIVAQCTAARVPVFVKQLGAAPREVLHGPRPPLTGVYEPVYRDRKGGDPAEWPEDLRVREFPKETL